MTMPALTHRIYDQYFHNINWHRPYELLTSPSLSLEWLHLWTPRNSSLTSLPTSLLTQRPQNISVTPRTRGGKRTPTVSSCTMNKHIVGCIYAPYKVNPNIFQFYFDFMDTSTIHLCIHSFATSMNFILFSMILFHLLLSTIITST